MSSKHIQLTDKNSNNLYPVSPVIVVEWDTMNKISAIPSSTITNNAITNDIYAYAKQHKLMIGLLLQVMELVK